jgi:hypothetical protein
VAEVLEEGLRKLAIAAAIIAATTISASAATLDFDFSYSNTFGSTAGSDPGLVTGVIELPSNCTTCAATAVIIDSLPAGFSIGETLPFDTTIAGDIVFNTFTIKNGALKSYNYYSDFSGTGVGIDLNAGTGEVGGNGSGTAGFLTFTEVASTPLPSTGALFATAVGLLGTIAFWRKRSTKTASPMGVAC